MSRNKLLIAVWSAAVLSFFVPQTTLACACCADPGEYLISNRKPDKYELDELAKIKFAPRVELFATAAEEDNKGLSKDLGELTLTGGFANGGWQLNFRDDTGKTGTLLLPIAAQMLNFKVDIHDTKAGAGDPVLYKEWRFQGAVKSGNGIFKSGLTAPAKYFLVFQGRGNVCDNASDFTHWRVEITGARAAYAFFGETVTAN